MFILVLQAIWLYIKELAGKDLDVVTIIKFLYYSMPVAVPIALPLSVLLAAILVFGNMAENYEFAAMKSNGISLQRAMRSLTIVILGIGLTSFFFANSVIPWGYLKQRNLRQNIAKVKPAMAISEGVFNQLGDINIRVAKKSGENGKFLNDVIIHKKDPRRSGNYTVIKSKTGELKSSLRSNVIQLVLYEGNYYNDMFYRDAIKMSSSPFVRSYFDSYTLNIDVSEINKVDLSEEVVTDNHRMLKARELLVRLDTFNTALTQKFYSYRKNQYRKWSPEHFNIAVKRDIDTVKEFSQTKNFFNDLSTVDQKRAINTAINKLKSQKATVENRAIQLKRDYKNIATHKIEIHKKFVLGAACIILFFIGAPLGAIIRKGGMGLPLVVATLFFLTYHFINIFAEKSAQEGAFPAWLGAWMGTLIIFPLGIILTYRATTDQGFFDLSGTVRSWFTSKKNLNKKAPAIE